MKKLIILSLAFFFMYGLSAQEKATHYDVIYLKDGSEFRGALLEYQPTYVTIKALGGKELRFEKDQIAKVVQEPIIVGKAKKPYLFKERGVYKALLFSVTPGTAAWNDDFAKGYGGKAVVGYQWNRWIGTGLGVGIENYYPGQGETVYPVFLELRGYLKEDNIAPYYTFSGGYAFTIVDEESRIIESKGGTLIHPAIGVRFGASDKANFTMDIGVQLQKATFGRGANGWGGLETVDYQMYYKRLAIRMGLLF